MNYKPTLSICRLKDKPDGDKPLSLSFLIWASLGDWSLLEMGKMGCFSLLVWGPAIWIPFGVPLVIGSEKGPTLPLSLSPSLSVSLAFPLLVADRLSGYVCMYVCMLVWFRL